MLVPRRLQPSGRRQKLGAGDSKARPIKKGGLKASYSKRVFTGPNRDGNLASSATLKLFGGRFHDRTD